MEIKRQMGHFPFQVDDAEYRECIEQLRYNKK